METEHRPTRLSLVVYLATDSFTAEQIGSAVKAFLKVNYKVKDRDIETHARTVKNNRNI